MSWFSSLLREAATYWSAPARDGRGGYIWSSPVSRSSKWEDVNTLVYGPNGASEVSSTVVYLFNAVEVGGYLYEGTFSGEPPLDSRQIISVRTVKSLVEQKTVVYKAFLR